MLLLISLVLLHLALDIMMLIEINVLITKIENMENKNE